MIDFLEKVKEFHETFDMPVLSEPTIPDSERCDLRISLLEEEINELKQAILDKDITEVFDAFNDILYILGGSILEFGMQDKFKQGFDEVHRSNMSKACKTVEEALLTIDKYKKSNNFDSDYIEKNNSFIVKRKDGKLLKSINYSPADLKKIIEK
jgi:predicted HAD superfamily Cof-like phosphohydrolase